MGNDHDTRDLNLSSQMSHFFAVVGRETGLAVLREMGGSEVFIMKAKSLDGRAGSGDRPEFRALRRILSAEQLQVVLHHFEQTTIYFPKLEKVSRYLRDKAIHEEFNGRNHYALSRKFHLTTRAVRKILETTPRPPQQLPTVRQASLF